MSLLCADTPDFSALLRTNGVELLWHPALSLEASEDLIALLENCLSGVVRLDALCIEGAMLRGPQGSGRFHVLAGTGVAMIDWVRKNRPKRVVLVTECSMADNVQAELPDVEFTRPCNLCPHMKRITLPKILDSLLHMKEEVVVDPMIAEKARRAVERMIYMKS